MLNFQPNLSVDKFVLTKEFKRFEKSLKELTKHSRRDIREVLASQAKLFCLDLVHVTQPWGKGSKARKMGENAVKKDIHKVYLTENDLYQMIKKESADAASSFYYHFKKGNIKEATQIARTVNISLTNFDGGRQHQRKRGRNGRINSVLTDQFAPSEEVKKYAVEVGKKVGFAKAGWAHAAEKLPGNTRVQKWIKRHSGNLGNIRYKTSGGIDQIIIINNVTYIKKILDRYHLLKALNSRGRAIQKLVKKVIYLNALKDSEKILKVNLAQMTSGLK